MNKNKNSKKSAITRLKEYVENDTVFLDTDYDRYRGGDWHRLSQSEEDVFELTLEQMPILVAVYNAYEGVVSICYNDIYGEKQLCTAVREELELTEGLSSLNEFQKFAKLFDVPYRLAHAFYYKHDFWLARCGILRFSDEIETKKELIACLKKAPTKRLLCTRDNGEDIAGFHWVVREVEEKIVVDGPEKTHLDDEPVIAFVEERLAEKLADEVHEEKDNSELKWGPWCSTFLLNDNINPLPKFSQAQSV